MSTKWELSKMNEKLSQLAKKPEVLAVIGTILFRQPSHQPVRPHRCLA
jgi:transcriptional regulatory protein LevR